ncbi:MAG: ABC transporter ATP-binding protein [Desulfobacteraceae bacterium]|nr:ABC transporter ATP-binding protein [Desulfobacteraceae bacterium]
MTTNIIEMENVSHQFSDGTIGVSDINLRIRSGELVVLAGPNGSGKTTLLRHLNGLLLPHHGHVRIDGIETGKNGSPVRRRVGMVFQDADCQIVGETVYDDIAFGPQNLRLDHAHITRRVGSAIKAVGLDHLADQRPHLLSGGEKRRLAIAGVLAMAPAVLLMDEPFSNLDYPGIQQVLELIIRLHTEGHTIIVATHDLEKIITHADRLIVLADGKIALDGLPEGVIAEVEAFGVRAPCAVRFGVKTESWLK